VPIEASLCHIIRGRKLLLKLANGGISKGKWNGPGGKFERGETPAQNVVREVREETSLRIIEPAYHGKIDFYMNGRDRLDYLVHVFLATRFSGRATNSDEGRVEWFDLDKIPYGKMWDDDRYWLPLLLNGMKFNARFFYDKANRRVVSYEITSRPSL
jgi:8-oxo-dGTP diphosphatase